MLVRTMHEVREDMGPLVAMVMCSVPSDEPFTLIVQTSDGTAVGEQMNELSLEKIGYVRSRMQQDGTVYTYHRIQLDVSR